MMNDEDPTHDTGSDAAVPSVEQNAPDQNTNAPDQNVNASDITISINIGNSVNETTIRRRRLSRENRESHAGTLVNIAGGGTRRVHVHRTHNGGRGQVRIITDETGRSARMQPVPRMQVSLLQPQPLPHTPSSIEEANGAAAPREDKADFHCLVCFEFLQDPASCGKCNSRFCFACISRVAEMGANGSPPKCPTCRCEYQLSDIKRDVELHERMQRAATVSCQYKGCSAQLLLGQVASHEATCLFVPIMCRYSTFGCTWKGLRNELVDHESTCPLMQVSSLVEQFRQARADHEHALSHVQTRIAASNAMMELHAAIIRRLHKRLYHPGDLLDLVYSITCTPARFIYNKDIWRSMYVCRLARGVICNILTFLPITLLVLRITAQMFREILQLETAWQNGNVRDSSVLILMAVLILLLWILMIMCFNLDGKTSVEWNQQPRCWKCAPVLQELCAMACWALFFNSISFDGGGFKASMVWLFVCTCTAYFPSHIVSMLESCNGVNQTVPTNVFCAGRAVPIVLFGMRHAFMAHLMGILPWLDAVLLQSVLRKFLPEKLAPFCVWDDCFFSSINTEVLLGYASGSVAIILVDWNKVDRLFETLGALILLLVVNHLTNKLVLLGNIVSQSIFSKVKQDLLPNQSGVRKEFSLTGVVCFCTWTCLLGFILLSF